jgi:DNA-binding Lrp family transcriptional regulator
MKAIVLIKIETGEIKEAFRDIKRLPRIVHTQFVCAHLTFGPYDAIVVIEADDLNTIGKIVEREIQPIPGILQTLTCLIVEGELFDEVRDKTRQEPELQPALN